MRGLTVLLGRSGVSWRRRVDRCRRTGLPAGSTFPRTPDLVISSSSSRMSSSKSSVSWPSSSAWSRSCWASERSVTHHCWSSVAGSGVKSGSSSRCQPSRHCAARKALARSAQAGQTCARVCPHGTRTCVVSPVSRLVRRSWTGRMQAPCSTARSLTTCGASGMVIRSARVVLAAGAAGSVTRSPPQGRRWSRCRPSRTGGTPPRLGSVPSSCRIRPVAQTGHGSSVRQTVTVVMRPPPASSRSTDSGCATARSRISASETHPARTRTGSGSASSRTNATPPR